MKNRNDSYLLIFVLFTGIASVTTQLVMIREFLSLFSGNEFVIALILFNWLVLGAVGTLSARKVAGVSRGTSKTAIRAGIVLCATGPAQIIVARYLAGILFLEGGSTGFYTVFGFTMALFAPYSILAGFLLAFCVILAGRLTAGYPLSRVYLADNIGDALGGALFSFLLVFLFTPVQAVVISNGLLLGVIGWWRVIPSQRQSAGHTWWMIGAAVIMAGSLLAEPVTLSGSKGELVFYHETPYGRVAVYELHGARALYLNGVPLFDTVNTQSAEKHVHLPLSQVDDPERVLFISASAGVFLELSKYPYGCVDYLEIDPRVSQAMFSCSFLAPVDRLEVITVDARHFLKTTSNIYDAVIIDIPEPDTFQSNRFYTAGFFDLLSSRLSDTGAAVFSVTGYDHYPSKAVLEKLSIIFQTAGKSFSDVMVLPGPKTFFLLKKTQIQPDIPAILAKKGIDAPYMETGFSFDYSKEKQQLFLERRDRKALVNTDFNPVLIKNSFRAWFEKFDTSPEWLWVVGALVFGIYLFRLNSLETLVFFTGFAAMGFETMILFVFQVLFGYIYIKTGMIVTLFLAGLIPGALAGTFFNLRISRPGVFALDAVISAGIFFFVLVTMVFKADAGQWFYFMSAFMMGLICGLQFVCMMNLKNNDPSRITLFLGADIMGAAAGVICFSLVLLPAAGLLKAGIMLGVIKCMGTLRALTCRK